MRVALLTREYPPEVYGGAGVHVEYLSRELRALVDVDVHCMGAPRHETGVTAHTPDPRLATANAALQVMSTDLAMVAATAGADLVHSHTWYANFAGHTAKLLHGVPHVVTTHSLEPLRPWKAEQLGGGYALSSFCERTALESADAVVAVSGAMRDDVLRCYPSVDPAAVRVVHNGIDTDQYSPVADNDVLVAHGVDVDRPVVLFVGRITRQKGLPYLLAAARRLTADAQLVLLAGAADTAEIRAEVAGLVGELQAGRHGVVWIEQMLPREQVRQFLSHATVFVCPSIYEPMGIVNLEAMACGTAVVATATGGIPEVVADGECGYLVPIEPDPGDPYGAPRDPEAFAAAMAERIDRLLDDPGSARRMGETGRRRAVEEFGWAAVARRTHELYLELLD